MRWIGFTIKRLFYILLSLTAFIVLAGVGCFWFGLIGRKPPYFGQFGNFGPKELAVYVIPRKQTVTLGESLEFELVIANKTNHTLNLDQVNNQIENLQCWCDMIVQDASIPQKTRTYTTISGAMGTLQLVPGEAVSVTLNRPDIQLDGWPLRYKPIEAPGSYAITCENPRGILATARFKVLPRNEERLKQQIQDLGEGLFGPESRENYYRLADLLSSVNESMAVSYLVELSESDRPFVKWHAIQFLRKFSNNAIARATVEKALNLREEELNIDGYFSDIHGIEERQYSAAQVRNLAASVLKSWASPSVTASVAPTASPAP